MQETENPQQNDSSRDYTRWFGVGIEFCGVIGFFCYIGYKLDKAWNTSPWFLLSGFFVGFTGMFYMILKQVWNMRRK